MEHFYGIGVMLSMEKTRTCWNQIFWNFWPLIRLAIALVAFTLWTHALYVWNPAAIEKAARITARLILLIWLASFFSVRFAKIILIVLLFPIFAAVFLNHWLYVIGRAFFRSALRLRSRSLCASLALAVELGLLLSLWRSAEFLLRSYGF
jgi:hypothetical protein